MAIDNIIAAGIQPATPIMSPMQTMGGLMQLRGQMADQSLREAQMVEVRQRQQNEKLKADQANRDLTDQNTLQALSPEDHAKMYSGDLSVLHGKVQPTTIQNVLKSVDEHINKLATNDGLKLKNRGDALDQLGKIVVNLGIPNADGSAPNSETINSQYQSLKGQLPELFKLAGIDGPPPETIQTLDELRGFQVKLSAAKAATDAALKRKQDTADAKKTTIEAEKGQFELDLMKGAANGGQDAAIMKRFGANTEAAQAAIDAYRQNLPAGLAAATQAVNKIYDEQIGGAARIVSETPAKVAEQAALLPGKVKEATSVAYAQIAPHIKQAVGTQLELAKRSGEAFASVTDPTERHRAEAAMEKSSLEYADKVSESRTLTSLIDAAQKGNKAAPAVIGLQELRGFVNRVNTTELKAVGSQAGSLKDQVEGWLRGKTEGQPIPPEILKATRELANLQEKAARSNYENKILITNTTYGSKVKPIDLPGGSVAPIALKDGTTLTPHDQASADAFRKEHPDLIK